VVRVNLLLSLLLVVCALGLVSSQDRARKLFVDLERAQAQAARLEVQWDQLQIEQTALAKAARIDTKARRELAMEAISPQRTLHLVVDPADGEVRVGPNAPDVEAAREAATSSAARDAATRGAGAARDARNAHKRPGGQR